MNRKPEHAYTDTHTRQLKVWVVPLYRCGECVVTSRMVPGGGAVLQTMPDAWWAVCSISSHAPAQTCPSWSASACAAGRPAGMVKAPLLTPSTCLYHSLCLLCTPCDPGCLPALRMYSGLLAPGSLNASCLCFCWQNHSLSHKFVVCAAMTNHQR